MTAFREIIDASTGFVINSVDVKMKLIKVACKFILRFVQVSWIVIRRWNVLSMTSTFLNESSHWCHQLKHRQKAKAVA